MHERELVTLEGYNVISCFPYAIALEPEAETCESSAKVSPIF